MFREVNASSRIPNHINRNIDQDCSTNDADIEILNINSPDTQDSENHETSLSEAWRFIDIARNQNFTQNEVLQRNSRDYRNLSTYNRREVKFDNIEQNYINISNMNITSRDDRNEKSRNFCFPDINDYLDSLDNSSDEETPNTVEQNYFNFEHAPDEAVEVYDGTIYAVANEGPMLIYSYKNKNYTTQVNEVPINSPNQESQSNSTSSVSVENFNEESVNYEKSFYRISTSFHPIIIPRIPLTTYMLPTVAEIVEPNRQSPKITEIYENDTTVKRKPTNSWVTNDNNSSHSDANNTTETNVESATDESPDNTKQSLNLLNNSTLSEHENHSKTYDMKENANYNNNKEIELHLKDSKAAFISISTRDSMRNTSEEKINQKNNNYLDTAAIELDSASKESIEKDSSKSKYMNTSTCPIEILSMHSSVPTLHLSLNTEMDTIEQSWFKKCLKCILCCK